jgi:hypothetical protein
MQTLSHVLGKRKKMKNPPSKECMIFSWLRPEVFHSKLSSLCLHDYTNQKFFIRNIIKHDFSFEIEQFRAWAGPVRNAPLGFSFFYVSLF